MTYRGVYRDGVIVPGDSVNIPDGTPIEFAVARSGKTRARTVRKKTARGKNGKRTRMTAEERVAAFMKGFGISRDRPEWKGRTTQEIARELRRRAGGNWTYGREARRG